MAFEVIVDTPAQFAAWAARQRAEAPEPAEGELRRGREVFLGSTCVMCHAVGGTDASARKAPDLTHVGSRTTLAAGTLRNDAESMTRWIRNPQQIKPGVNMPASTLGDADLKALVAWLGSLQ
jgi:cytochrome c oxidase subunit 2